METRQSLESEGNHPDGFPDAASVAALRAWYEGLSAREAVARYLVHSKADGESSRGMLGVIRCQLVDLTKRCHRPDLAALFDHPVSEQSRHARAEAHAI